MAVEPLLLATSTGRFEAIFGTGRASMNFDGTIGDEDATSVLKDVQVPKKRRGFKVGSGGSSDGGGGRSPSRRNGGSDGGESTSFTPQDHRAINAIKLLLDAVDKANSDYPDSPAARVQANSDYPDSPAASSLHLGVSPRDTTPEPRSRVRADEGPTFPSKEKSPNVSKGQLTFGRPKRRRPSPQEYDERDENLTGSSKPRHEAVAPCPNENGDHHANEAEENGHEEDGHRQVEGGQPANVRTRQRSSSRPNGKPSAEVVPVADVNRDEVVSSTIAEYGPTHPKVCRAQLVAAFWHFGRGRKVESLECLQKSWAVFKHNSTDMSKEEIDELLQCFTTVAKAINCGPEFLEELRVKELRRSTKR